MKSKKKFLLLGVGVMGALALGVGATSTFAWYQASASGTAAYGAAASGTFKASDATAKEQTYFLRVTFAAANDDVAMTDYNGGLWAVKGVTDGNATTYYMVEAKLGANQVKVTTIGIASFEWYRSADGAANQTASDVLSPAEKATIVGSSLNVYFQGARARFKQSATEVTAANFSSNFGSTNNANKKATVSLTIADGGAVSLTNPLYASISGTASDDSIPTVGQVSTDFDGAYSASNTIGAYTVSAS